MPYFKCVLVGLISHFTAPNVFGVLSTLNMVGQAVLRRFVSVIRISEFISFAFHMSRCLAWFFGLVAWSIFIVSRIISTYRF